MRAVSRPSGSAGPSFSVPALALDHSRCVPSHLATAGSAPSSGKNNQFFYSLVHLVLITKPVKQLRLKRGLCECSCYYDFSCIKQEIIPETITT